VAAAIVDQLSKSIDREAQRLCTQERFILSRGHRASAPYWAASSLVPGRAKDHRDFFCFFPCAALVSAIEFRKAPAVRDTSDGKSGDANRYLPRHP